MGHPKPCAQRQKSPTTRRLTCHPKISRWILPVSTNHLSKSAWTDGWVQYQETFQVTLCQPRPSDQDLSQRDLLSRCQIMTRVQQQPEQRTTLSEGPVNHQLLKLQVLSTLPRSHLVDPLKMSKKMAVAHNKILFISYHTRKKHQQLASHRLWMTHRRVRHNFFRLVVCRLS